jgi:hypothetical protein
VKIGDLRRFHSEKDIFSHFADVLLARVFFISRILDDEGYEITLLDDGQKWIMTYQELRYYSKILQADKKCP